MNLKEILKNLEDMSYKYIVKAKNKKLSGRGESEAHIQLMAVKNLSEVYFLMADLKEDSNFNNVKYQPIDNYEAIEAYTKNKNYTIKIK